MERSYLRGDGDSANEEEGSTSELGELSIDPLHPSHPSRHAHQSHQSPEAGGEAGIFSSTSISRPAHSSHRKGLIAPWWHTALMVLLIGGLSANGAHQMHASGNQPLHLIPNYLLTIAYEWALAGLVLWGIHMRGISRAQLLGSWPPGMRAWLSDIGAAITFWIIALLLLAVITQVLQRGLGSHFSPQNISDVTEKLAPATPVEMVLFLILSISAGICEEFVFRGYLQQQFGRMGRSIWAGVVLSALMFGCAHGYEGISGVLLIAAYGAMFSVLVLFRRGLRTGMIAHVWHDSISGIALVFLHHYGSHFGAK